MQVSAFIDLDVFEMFVFQRKSCEIQEIPHFHKFMIPFPNKKYPDDEGKVTKVFRDGHTFR